MNAAPWVKSYLRVCKLTVTYLYRYIIARQRIIRRSGTWQFYARLLQLITFHREVDRTKFSCPKEYRVRFRGELGWLASLLSRSVPVRALRGVN